jgi:hypothetical protein
MTANRVYENLDYINQVLEKNGQPFSGTQSDQLRALTLILKEFNIVRLKLEKRQQSTMSHVPSLIANLVAKVSPSIVCMLPLIVSSQ